MKLVRFENPVLSHFAGFGRLSSLENELNRLFTESTNNSWAPLVELSEDKNNFLVTAELPGLKKEDIDVTLLDGVLTISGERKQERNVEEGAVHRSERYFGRFERAITLPSEVAADGVKADYKDGLLTVTLPKTEAAKPKKIGIGVS